MKISVAGTGYIGLSIATLLSQHNKVGEINDLHFPHPPSSAAQNIHIMISSYPFSGATDRVCKSLKEINYYSIKAYSYERQF